MGLRDDLNKLTRREWQEVLTQEQRRWMDDSRAEMNIRFDALLQRIEDACRIPHNGGTRVLRLGDVTDSTQGIIPYQTKAESQANAHIRPRSAVPSGDATWHPLLDTHSSIGRYTLRWGAKQHYLHYGDWLCRPREQHFFESPKILFIRLRNRSLKRRLVATYDATGFYNRHNFSNVITRDGSDYDLKYILALFNSPLLNFWYARQFPDVEVAIDDTRKLPIYPADATTQARIVALVDQLLAEHATLNRLRDQGYRIVRRGGAGDLIELPYDRVLAELQARNPEFTPYTLLDAIATGVVSVPAAADQSETISSNVFVPPKYPNSVVLRRNKLWLEVPDADLRDYLVAYLGRPRWHGRPWTTVAEEALLPVRDEDRAAFAAALHDQRAEISARLDRIDQLDQQIDQEVFALYGISDPAEQARVLGSAPRNDDDAGEDTATAASDGEGDTPDEAESV